MKKKNILCTFLVSLVLMVGLIITACPSSPEPQPKEAGPETGKYYYALPNNEEFTIILSNGDKFSFDVMGEIKAGTYELTDNSLVFTFYKEPNQTENQTLTATYNETFIDLIYNGQPMRFLKKINFNVSFDVGPAEQIEPISVLNGKTISAPQAPTLFGYHFMGWYTDQNYTTPFAFDTQCITSDTTIYARWVVDDPTIPEYLVELDFNMEDEPTIVRQTIGGKLYDLPTPTRRGYEFKGWWISNYEDAQKLSYKYTDGMIIKENTKLFAYWQSINSGSKLPNPVVNISGNTISWEGIVGANTYTLEVNQVINAEKNEFKEIIRRVDTTTFYNLDFENLDAGDYIIKVIANATNPNDSSENTLYFKNKALARVSHFTVTEPSILSFNAVEGATSYEISIDVGDELINKNINNGNNTFFDFSGFPMPQAGIKFTITAKAEGRASSTRTYVYNRVLGQIEEIYFDEETETLHWAKVPNATNYILSIASGNSTDEDTYIDIGNRTSYSLKTYAGQEGGIIVNIYPKTKGWNSPQPARYVYEKIRLASPKSIKIQNRTITWNEIPNATEYEIKIGSFTDRTSTNSYELPEDFQVNSNLYHINIKAKGQHESLWSDPFALRGSMSNLVYQSSVASWDYVLGAVAYEVFVNGVMQSVVESGDNYAEIILTAGGINIISARAVFEDGEYSNTISTSVYAHTVRFETGEGKKLSEVYYATGDKIREIEGERDGYDFTGWYLYTGHGVAGKFTDTYYEFTGDITLYATWDTVSFTVKYDFAGGTGVNEYTRVKFDTSFEFEVPTIDDGRVFGGWYTLENGLGIRLTDEFGKSVRNWDISGEDIVVYAYWARAINYYPYSDKNQGWVVGKGPDIDRISHLVIPQTYKTNEYPDPKPILEIDAFGFADLANLITVKMPNTITAIGSNAFAGCVNLESYELYGDYFAPEYSTLDGVLFNADQTEIVAFPIAKKGEYIIPTTITRILSGVFLGTVNLTKLIIPASVHSYVANGILYHGIDSKAFYNCTSLTTVEFLPPDNGEALPLSFGDYAFQNCVNLKEIILPARLEDFTYLDDDKEVTTLGFNYTVFAGCASLENIFVEDNNKYYADIDGVIVNKEKNQLIFYPMGKTENYIIPESITNINSYAFKGIKNPFELIISKNVEIIEPYAFEECVGLKKMTIVARDNEIIISGYAFYNCSGLIEMDFEEGCNLISIGDYAFYKCTNLSNLVIPGSVTKIGKNAFERCGLLSLTFSATEGDAILTLGEFAFYYCISLQHLTFEDGCNIEIISRSAFSSCHSLLSIIIPESVKEIKSYAFSTCRSLTTLTIPKNVSKIESGAFYNCYALVSITIEDSTTDLVFEGNVFSYCTSLVTMFIPARVKQLDLNAFNGCTSITGIYVDENNSILSDIDGVLYSKDKTILIYYPLGRKTVEYIVPNGVEIINENVFKNYQNLEKIVLPASITLIERQAFSYCENLKEVIFTEGNNANFLTINNRAFANCKNLTTVIFPSHLYRLEYAVFDYCSSLKTLNFGENSKLDYIASSVFWDCKSLTEFTIPKSTTFIGTSAFYNCISLKTVYSETGGDQSLDFGMIYGSEVGTFNKCYNLKTVYLPARTRMIGSYTFAYCKNLTEIYFEEGSRLETIANHAFTESSITSIVIPKTIKNTSSSIGIGNNAFANCEKLSSVIFEEGGTEVFSIGTRVFTNCRSLTEINLPSNLDTIGSGAFEGCTKLMNINVHANNANLSSIDGVLFNKDKSILMLYPFGRNGAYEVPGSVKTIANNAFTYAAGLTALTFAKADLDENGKEIPLEIGTGTSSTYVFRYCYNLKTVELPERLTSIGNYAFEYCTSIEEIYLPKNLTKLGSYAFRDAASLKQVTFDKDIDLKEIGSNAFYYAGVEKISIPDSVTSIGNSAFYRTKLKEITFGENSNLTSIGSSAFYDTLIENITLPSKVTSIGSTAFGYCANLESIDIPAGVTSITISSSHIFTGCNSLKSINIHKDNTKYTSIDGVLFDKNVETLLYYPRGKVGAYVIPSGVKKIGQYSFGEYNSTNGSYNLTSVTIPLSVTSIDSYAFGYSYGLKSIIFEKDTEGNAPELSIGTSASSSCYAFAYSGLSSIEIPARTKLIGAYAFYQCKELKILTFEKSNKPIDLTLGNNAFEYAGITSVEIPARLISMGNYAFSYCANLSSIRFEQDGKLKNLPQSAFANCTSLTSIYIPKFIETINYWAFRECTNLTSVTFEEGSNLKEFGGFYRCTNLNEINNIPQNISTFTSSALYQTAVTEFFVPTNVTKIPDSAYAYTQIEKAIIPDTVKELGNSVFLGCANLKEVELPNTITTISNYLFQNCVNLTKITIPDTVRTIGNYAFQNNKSLRYIVIPEGVTSIGNNAFEGCENLVSVILPSSLTTIGTSAFKDCYSLTDIVLPSKVTQISNYLFEGSGLISYTIPSSITRIGDYAFRKCISLREINIPANVNQIGNSPFAGCLSLENINVAANNLDFIAVDGVLYNSNQTRLISFPAGKQGNYSILDTTTSIDPYAFYNCIRITEIVIPEKVTTINTFTFSGCEFLYNVVIKGDLTSIASNAFSYSGIQSFTVTASVKTISDSAFKDSKLKELIFEQGGSSLMIGTSAFENCTSLTRLEIPNHIYSTTANYRATAGIGTYSFRGCINLTEVIFEDNGANGVHLGSSAFENCTKLQRIIFPNHLMDISYSTPGGTFKAQAIGESAFKNCINLSEVVLKASPTGGTLSFSSYAFENCLKLKQITLPENMYEIASGVFKGSGIEEIVLPSSVAILRENVFQNCLNLESVVIDGTMNNIPQRAFQNCINLRNIEIRGTKITGINAYAFDGCSNLTQITLPSSLTQINEFAFAGCTSIKEIYIPTSVTTMKNNVFAGWSSNQIIYIGLSSPGTSWYEDWQDGCFATIVWSAKKE